MVVVAVGSMEDCEILGQMDTSELSDNVYLFAQPVKVKAKSMLPMIFFISFSPRLVYDIAYRCYEHLSRVLQKSDGHRNK